MSRLLLFVLVFSPFVGTSLVYREKRQTVVGSQSNTNGQGDQVDTEAMAHHYKNSDGVIGMNVSSGGNASGHDSAAIQNNAQGQVGDSTLDAIGDVNAKGQDSEARSDIFAVIAGENRTITSYQQGKASGVGDTLVQATGGVNSNDGMKSDTIATSGATGSLGSQSEVLSNQVLTWDSLMAQLVGSAVAEGLGNAQANVDLGAGNADNGVEMNGVVSGVQSGGGNVNAQVNGNANMNGDKHDLTGNIYGKVNGTGNSTMVGATHIQSNTTSNTSVSAFGDSKIHSDGQSAIDLMSETALDNQKPSATGEIIMNGTDVGANHDMTVNNGLKVKDNNGETLAIGNGNITGTGTENSNASIIVDTSYKENGQAQVIANGEGSAISTGGQNSSLNMGVHGDLNNTNGLSNTGSASGSGSAYGEYNNVTGNSFINIDGSGSNGNSMMESWGGGKGNSSAQTNTVLQLNEGNVSRNMTVNGGVSATGDKTSSHSISTVTDYGGQQTLSNYQKATSSATGSSSASASNYGVLKRKKRALLGVLFDRLF